MGIGASIFLLALGAILAFAVNADISGLDINVIGWILMLAGLVGLVITLWFWNSRRRTVRDPDAAAGHRCGLHQRVPRGPPRRRSAPAAPRLLLTRDGPDFGDSPGRSVQKRQA